MRFFGILVFAVASLSPVLGAGLLSGVESANQGEKLSIDPDFHFGWLEKSESARVKDWTEDQNQKTRAALDEWPGRARVRERLKELMAAGSLSKVRHVGGRVFYEKRSGLDNQPVLYVRDSPDFQEQPVLDVNKLDPEGETALDWWFPSHDGLLIAYGLSTMGSEDSTLRIRTVDSGLDLPDMITRTANASVAWLPDRTGFYYTRYPRPGAVPAGEESYHKKIYFHVIGENPLKDQEAFDPDRPKEEWPEVQVSRNGQYLVVTTREGPSQSKIFARYLSRRTTDFWEVTEGREGLFEGKIGGDSLYIRTNEDAPRFRVMSVDLRWPKLKWKEVVAEGPAALRDFEVAGTRLAVEVLERVSSRLRIHSLKGAPLAEIPIPPRGGVKSFAGNFFSQNLFIIYESFFTPPTLYRYDLAFDHKAFFKPQDRRPLVYRPAQEKHLDERRRRPEVGDPALTALGAAESPAGLENFEFEQAAYNSLDKTKVSMFLLRHKRVKRDKNAPTILTGYGAFGVSATPSFRPHLLLWLEKGGLYALANLRGGGEDGEAWHRAGMLGKKQNTIDDFKAAAHWLIEKEYTRAERLGGYGASDGALIVGAAITQEPDLFRAAVLRAPLLDMMRFHRYKSARLLIPEYGSPEIPAQLKWLYSYSPYHKVKSGAAYPALLFMAGGNDSRVDPMHARKMTARLQKDAKPGYPVLLRLDTEAGHGIGRPLSQEIDQLADRYGFLMRQLGVSLDETP